MARHLPSPYVRGMQSLNMPQALLTARPLALAVLMAVAAAAAVPALSHMGVIGLPVGPAAPSTLPDCRDADLPASRSAYDDWATTLLDTTYRLSPDYEPPDLVVVGHGPATTRLRAFVVPKLLAMIEAARADGVSIRVTSGHRSHERQAAVFEELVNERGEEHARRWAARPGHSEHQLGTTVDLQGGADWLAQHAWRFGFLMSYPAGRSPQWTCYGPEPWHYRYFGRDRAATIRASGLSPREWLWEREMRR